VTVVAAGFVQLVGRPPDHDSKPALESISVPPAAAWFTVKVCPAMVIVPLRTPPVFWATVYDTVPLPVPLEPAMIVTHAAVLVAVQLQPAPAVTETLALLPAAAGEELVGLIEYVQLPPEAWLTVKVRPAIVMVPVRAPLVFWATEYDTVPLPVPLAPPVIAIHASLLVADQLQPDVAVTVTEADPPAAAGEVLIGLIE
jgi:hypothetical protein